MSSKVVDESTKKLVQGEVVDDIEKKGATNTKADSNIIMLGEKEEPAKVASGAKKPTIGTGMVAVAPDNKMDVTAEDDSKKSVPRSNKHVKPSGLDILLGEPNPMGTDTGNLSRFDSSIKSSKKSRCLIAAFSFIVLILALVGIKASKIGTVKSTFSKHIPLTEKEIEVTADNLPIHTYLQVKEPE